MLGRPQAGAAPDRTTPIVRGDRRRRLQWPGRGRAQQQQRAGRRPRPSAAVASAGAVSIVVFIAAFNMRAFIYQYLTGAPANYRAEQLLHGGLPPRVASGGIPAVPVRVVAAASEESSSDVRASTVATAASGDDGRTGRFPRYGTPEYSRRCSWLTNAVKERPPSSDTCTVHYGRAQSRPSEGISFWLTQVVSSHLFALQGGCALVFDYGAGMDIERVITSPDGVFNWTVPDRYDCDKDPKCYTIDGKKLDGRTHAGMHLHHLNRTLAPVPRYRQSYGLERFRAGDGIADQLAGALPGFDLRDGMACSLGALIALPPGASEFEPGLFTDILPTLRDEEALVIGVYARTGWADYNEPHKRKSMVEKGQILRDSHGGYVPSNATMAELMDSARKVVEGALELEKRFLASGRAREEQQERDFGKIVWMVTTDWPHIKEWAADLYDGADANAALPPQERRYPTRRIPRRIVTTHSQGRHTKTNARPELSAFAGGFLDWLLLGETDAVVKWRYSFAETAALRTAADVYQGSTYKPFPAPEGSGVAYNEADGSIWDVAAADLPKKRGKKKGDTEMQRLRVKK